MVHQISSLENGMERRLGASALLKFWSLIGIIRGHEMIPQEEVRRCFGSYFMGFVLTNQLEFPMSRHAASYQNLFPTQHQHDRFVGSDISTQAQSGTNFGIMTQTFHLIAVTSNCRPSRACPISRSNYGIGG